MRYTFVISPPKTGSTLITRMMCQHPDVAVMSESYVLAPDHHDSLIYPGSRKVQWHGFTDEQAARWREMVVHGDGDDKHIDYEGWRAAMMEMMTDFGERRGATVSGDSWPLYCGHLSMLGSAFPDAKIIFGTRDPRAVFWSGETFEKSKANGAAFLQHLLAYEHEMRKFREARGNVLVYRYEDLVADPAKVMREVWEFLEVDPGRGWIEYDPERDPFPDRWSWIPNAVDGVDASRIDRWREEMPKEAIRDVSSAAQDYTKRYGYEQWPGNDFPDGELVRRFVSGQKIADLGDDAETRIRGQIARMSHVIGVAMTGIQKMAEAIDTEIEKDIDSPEPSHWKRWYRFGVGAGKAIVGGMAGQLHNRLLREITQ